MPPSRSTLTGAELSQEKKSCIYVYRVTSVMYESLRPCRLWPARFLFQRGGFSKQEYWSILANTCCHTLLEHYISCFPSCQPLRVPGASRTPATQAAVPPPHLALTWANPSPPGQPQELNLSGRPTCRGGNKTTVETQGQCG